MEGFIYLALILVLYFVPTIYAFHKKKNNAGAIGALNFFLGWTVLGWIVALIWASANDNPVPQAVNSNRNVGDELEKLASLKEKGVLTEQEFQSQKEALMRSGGIAAATSSRKPMSKKTKKILIWGGVIFVGFTLLGIVSEYFFPTPDTTSVAPVTTHPAAAVFDVPSLVGKNVDQVTKALGTAENDDEPTPRQMSLGITEWYKTYKKDGESLVVTYNPNSRKVTDFFIDSSSGSTNNTDRLLQIGNLMANDPRYSIEFVKSLKGDGYTGVKVIPK